MNPTERAYDAVPLLVAGSKRPGDEVLPLSGRLFTFRPGVRGIRPHLWAGR
ncbi:hypothetical protein [Microbacterium sp. NPDC056057]|uniref:hypothetical protein n=1 Tax=Microbacterium sp. NPDC056057 TaxID=3345699 RepID=UPI0035E017E3